MIGKGADAVISLVHNYFEQHSLGEEEIIIHADNCSGQNKSNAMIQCLAWRVLTGKHKRITYSFMVAGHTKFSPDGFFNILLEFNIASKVNNFLHIFNLHLILIFIF